MLLHPVRHRLFTPQYRTGRASLLRPGLLVVSHRLRGERLSHQTAVQRLVGYVSKLFTTVEEEATPSAHVSTDSAPDPARVVSKSTPSVQSASHLSASETDVTIRSSDGMLFTLPRSNLKKHTKRIPYINVVAKQKRIIDLPENAKTLRLLFQCFQPQPDLVGEDFETLEALADAAEKYEVLPALEICKVYMKAAASTLPMPVFTHAEKHGHVKLFDELAPLKQYDPMLFLPVIYREQWTRVWMNALQPPPAMQHKGGVLECPHWAPFQTRIISSLPVAGVESQLFKLDIDKTFRKAREKCGLDSKCKYCTLRTNTWQTMIAGALAEIRNSAVKALVK